MAKKSLDPNLAAILDSIRATVGSDSTPTGDAEPAADTVMHEEAGEAAARPAGTSTGASAHGRAAIPQQTVEEFLAELIRPQVKAWLDARLPELVQQITAQEIARILDRE